MRSFVEPFGVTLPDWLGDTRFAMPTIIVFYLWKDLGFSAVVS